MTYNNNPRGHQVTSYGADHKKSYTLNYSPLKAIEGFMNLPVKSDTKVIITNEKEEEKKSPRIILYEFMKNSNSGFMEFLSSYENTQLLENNIKYAPFGIYLFSITKSAPLQYYMYNKFIDAVRYDANFYNNSLKKNK